MVGNGIETVICTVLCLEQNIDSTQLTDQFVYDVGFLVQAGRASIGRSGGTPRFRFLRRKEDSADLEC